MQKTELYINKTLYKNEFKWDLGLERLEKIHKRNLNIDTKKKYCKALYY